MLEIKSGNLFNSGCEAFVNAVNTQGISGKGIALVFKKRYPEMFLDYKKECDNGNLFVGKIHVWKGENTPYIINFPTKKEWRYPSQYVYIEQGLIALDEKIKELRIKSIALPALGCANGKLDFNKIKKMIQEFHDVNWNDIKVLLYQPW